MSIHFVLQGKGGVGKSYVSSLLGQFFSDTSTLPLYCADTDPVNQTFAGYGRFKAQKVDIMNEDKNIDQRAFDKLIEHIVEFEGNVVIDNGASTFIPLSAYLVENGVIDLLKENGKEVFIHSVITGGQSREDTISGLNEILSSQPCQTVIWENEFFGDVSNQGVRFKDSGMYKMYEEKIKGMVTLHRLNQDTSAKDLQMMIGQKLTFDEAYQSTMFSLMPRQRLKTIQKSIYSQLAALSL